MRDERTYLFDMLDSARLVAGYVEGLTFEQFASQTMLQDAVVRRLTIIGEAAKRISDATRASLPSMPFDDMARMRDKMTHVYWRVDLRIVWETATRDLPPLVAAVAPLLAKSAPDKPETDPEAGRS